MGTTPTARRITEQEIRVQVLGLLRHFEDLGATIENVDAVTGLVSGAAIRALVGGMTEKKFKRLAEYAYRSAQLAQQIADAQSKRIVVVASSDRPH